MRDLQLFARLTKVDEIRHEVTGVLAEEAPDKSGEILDYESSKPFFKAWNAEFEKATEGKSLGNVREMHQPVAVGKFVRVEYDDPAKQIVVTAKIVDRDAWQKVTEGVYTGFSIGGNYVKSWRDGEYVRYTAEPNEGSLVDNPCMYGAHFSAIKADGTTELRKFAMNSTRERPNSNETGADMNANQSTPDLSKFAQIEAVEKLSKRVEEQDAQIAVLSKTVENLTALLEKLLAEPEAPKVAANAVAVRKEDDRGRQSQAKRVEDPIGLIKQSHGQPKWGWA
jgi:hypothetical protein